MSNKNFLKASWCREIPGSYLQKWTILAHLQVVVYLDSPRVDGISAINISHPWKNIMVFLSANYWHFLVCRILFLKNITTRLFKVAIHTIKSRPSKTYIPLKTLQEIVGVRLPYLWFKNIQVPLSFLSLSKPRKGKGILGLVSEGWSAGGDAVDYQQGMPKPSLLKIWKGGVMIKHPFLMCLFLQFI